MAGSLLKNIQQGVEQFKIAKQYIVEVKKTANDVMSIGNEAVDFWGLLVKFFSGKPKSQVAKPVAKPKKPEFVAVEETQIKADIVKSLTEFFKLQAQLEDHIREAELRARTVVFADDVNLMEEALNRVLAQQEMEKLVVQIRECMVYDAPPEMGALYSSVFEMKDIIATEQEKARKKRDDESWLRKQNERLLQEKQAYVIATILFLLYTWMLIGLVAKIGKA
jgi:hypothetical protein